MKVHVACLGEKNQKGMVFGVCEWNYAAVSHSRGNNLGISGELVGYEYHKT